MGKVKIKKKSTWIDMTPMSDVMVLVYFRQERTREGGYPWLGVGD